MFKTLTRSMLAAMAFGGAVAGGSIGLYLLAGPKAGLWPVVVGGAVAAFILSGIGVTLIARSSAAFRTRLEATQTAEAVAGAPRWLRPTARTLVACLDRLSAREDAWATRERDLEIRTSVAEAGREQAEAVLKVMHEAVLVVNPFNEIVLANAAAGRLLNFDDEASNGRPLAEAVNDSTLRRIISETLEGAGNGTRQAELMLDDDIACEVTVGCVIDGQDRPSAAVVVLHDLTREREIAQMKSEFVSKASHELRTPLSSMRACVEMLVDGEADDPATREEFYGIIQSETERLSRLVDNMLNISRIEAGIIEVATDTVDLGGVIEQAMRTIEPQARERDQTAAHRHCSGRPACQRRPGHAATGRGQSAEQRSQVHARGRSHYRDRRFGQPRPLCPRGRAGHWPGHSACRHGSHLREVLPRRELQARRQGHGSGFESLSSHRRDGARRADRP